LTQVPKGDGGHFIQASAIYISTLFLYIAFYFKEKEGRKNERKMTGESYRSRPRTQKELAK